MQSGRILVWRVRLLLLAAAIGLFGVNADRIPVPLQPVQLGVQQVAPAPLLILVSTDTPDSRITPAAPSMTFSKRPVMLKMVQGPDIGAPCLDRSVSQRSLQKSPGGRQCKTWGGTTSTTRITHVANKQKLIPVGYAKKPLTLTAARRPGSGALTVAKRNDPRPIGVASKPRNVAPSEQLGRWAAVRDLYGPSGPS